MMNTKCNHSKGDMNVEAKSSSSGSCGKFIEVVIMLILIGSYYCFIHGYYCSTTVNTARTKLMLLHRSWDAIFDENRFSLVPRPSIRILNGTEDIGGSVVPEEVTEEVVTQQPEPETRKGKRNRTPKNFGPKF
ncbi:hypothetical protein Tco_0415265 [Tanacetum coccineum]